MGLAAFLLLWDETIDPVRRGWEEVVPYVPSVDSNLNIVEDTVNPLLAETFAYQETESVAPLQVFAGVTGSVWLCGMLALLIFAAASMVRLRLSVREAVICKENIYICDAVKSPFILGIKRSIPEY